MPSYYLVPIPQDKIQECHPWRDWFEHLRTAVNNIVVIPGTGTVTSVAQTVPSFLKVTGSPITTSGTLAISYSGLALPVPNGGTGDTSLTDHAVLLGAGTNPIAFATASTAGYVLTSNGVSSDPSFQAIPVPFVTRGTAGYVWTGNGAGADPTFQALPADVEPIAFIVTCSDETTALTTGLKVTFRMPFAMTLTDVRGGLTTAATGATLFAFDLKENGTSVFSTKPTFTASSKTTVGAVTPAVISDSALANESEMTIIVDAVGSTIAGVGLKVTLIGTKP